MSGYIVASPFVTCCEFKGSGRERERSEGASNGIIPSGKALLLHFYSQPCCVPRLLARAHRELGGGHFTQC